MNWRASKMLGPLIVQLDSSSDWAGFRADKSGHIDLLIKESVKSI